MSEITGEHSAAGSDYKNLKDYKEAVVEGKTILEMAEAHAYIIPFGYALKQS